MGLQGEQKISRLTAKKLEKLDAALNSCSKTKSVSAPFISVSHAATALKLLWILSQKFAEMFQIHPKGGVEFARFPLTDACGLLPAG